MARRLLAVALAFVVIGAPLAGDICGAFCAEYAGRSTDPTVPFSHNHSSAEASQASHHHHSDTPLAPATGSAASRPVSHACGQVDAIITESRELSRAPIVVAADTVARITPTLARVLPPTDLDSRYDPTRIRSTSPLRI